MRISDWSSDVCSARSRDFPIVIGEADRLHRMCAPASAVVVDGGVGAPKSSQISAAKVKPSIPSPQQTRSVPNGTSWSTYLLGRPLRFIHEANQRFSYNSGKFERKVLGTN